MAFTITDSGSLVLNHDTVRAWFAEREEIEDQINLMEKRIAVIDEKIEAAKVLMPTLFVRRAVPADAPQKSVIEKIVDVLKSERPKVFTPREIRERLEGDERVTGSHPNYLYTAITRAVERNLIEKADDGYKAINTLLDD